MKGNLEKISACSYCHRLEYMRGSWLYTGETIYQIMEESGRLVYKTCNTCIPKTPEVVDSTYKGNTA